MKRKWRTLAAVVLLILAAGYTSFKVNRLFSSFASEKEKQTDEDSSRLLFYHDPWSHLLKKEDILHRSEIVGEEQRHVANEIDAKISSKHHPFDWWKILNGGGLNSATSLSDRDLKEVLDRIDRCLEATNLKRLAPLEVVRTNAARIVKEYRKVVPTSDRFLDSCSRNHCWETDYSIEKHLDSFEGRIGNVSFADKMNKLRAPAVSVLRKQFYNRFSSNLVCLPKIFLAGFPKCGSSFLWCFIKRIIHQSEILEAEKEPHFWVDAGAFKHFKEPSASDFSNYILNFAEGITQIEKESCVHSNVSLIDGSPNLMFNWPRFNKEQNDLANYCLVPSVLPHFLRSAKFIVIMRNPIKMLYSAFWFSCTMYGIKLSRSVQLKGPTLFHRRIEEKVNMFHDCMRDESDPVISRACSLNDSGYESCITQRLHLLDKCTHKINFNIFGNDLPKCGRSRVAMGIYFTHIRKWLSVVPKEKFLFLTLEELIADPIQTASSISIFLGVEQSAADIQKGAKFASQCNENSQDSVDYKTTSGLQMRNDTKRMLETFYRPFNTLLADLLQDTKFLWTS